MKMNVTDRDGKCHVLEFKAGDVLMHVLYDANLGLAAECGGSCACATCHVYISANDTARVGPATGDEEDMLDEAFEVKDGSRLSCQIFLGEQHDGLSLTVAPDWD